MKKVIYTLPVSIFKEGEQFIAYTPALDLSTSAKTYTQVKKRSNEIVRIFFEEIDKKGTLQEVLEELGWQKFDDAWSAPVIVAHGEKAIQIPLPA